MAAFSGSFTHWAKNEINPKTVQLDDIYDRSSKKFKSLTFRIRTDRKSSNKKLTDR